MTPRAWAYRVSALEALCLDDPLWCPIITRGRDYRLFALVGADEFVGPDRDGLQPFGVIAQDRQDHYSNWNPSSLPAARSKVTVDSQPPSRFVDPRRQSAKSAFPF